MDDNDKKQLDEAVRKAESAAMSRVNGIMAIAEQHGDALPAVREAAKAAISDSNVSVGDFGLKVLDMLEKADPLELNPKTHLDLSEQERQQFSVLRAIRATVTGDWKSAGFERECSDEIAKRLDREARGFFLPFDFQTKQFQEIHGDERVMTSGGAGTGAELVGTDHLAGSFIDNLRARALLGRLGAIMLPGLTGNLDIPRKTSNASFGFVAEDTGATLSDVGTGALSLTPKILAGATSISRTLLKQSAPSVEDMVMMDLAVGAALGIDDAGFEGSGAANNPTGIMNTTGIATSTIAVPGSPTWAEVVEFETDVAEANGLNGNLAYVTTPGVRGNMKTASKDTGSGRFICEDNQVNGYACEVTTQLAANSMVFGNFSDVLIAMWGVLDVMHDTATKAASGGLVLRVFADVDVGVRNAGSFSKNA